MTLYLMLTTIKREQKHKVLSQMDSVLMELTLLVLITLLTGEWTSVIVKLTDRLPYYPHQPSSLNLVSLSESSLSSRCLYLLLWFSFSKPSPLLLHLSLCPHHCNPLPPPAEATANRRSKTLATNKLPPLAPVQIQTPILDLPPLPLPLPLPIHLLPHQDTSTDPARLHRVKTFALHSRE